MRENHVKKYKPSGGVKVQYVSVDYRLGGRTQYTEKECIFVKYVHGYQCRPMTMYALVPV